MTWWIIPIVATFAAWVYTRVAGSWGWAGPPTPRARIP